LNVILINVLMAFGESQQVLIKLEYMEHYKNKNVEEAKKNLIESVKLYNSDRPHFSISLLTPNYVHNNENAKTENLWKKQNVNLF